MAKVALLIGVSEYETSFAALPAAIKDVEAMRQVLQSAEIGGFDDVKTLMNPTQPEMAEAIETYFKDRQPDDLILFFFSGHGVKDERRELFFSARNTRKQREELVKSTAVSASFVRDSIKRSKAKRQITILDCCFSGAFGDFLGKDDGSVDIETNLGAEGGVVLTSSSSTQYSFEQKEAELSLYTRYLVEGMKTGAADQNGDGFVSVDELHHYACRKVHEAAPTAVNPKIIVLKDEGFKIQVAKAPVGDPKLRYRKEVERRVKEGKFSIPARRILDSLREELSLPPKETLAIEDEVLQPYREYQRKLQEYAQTLEEAVKAEYPLSEDSLNDLKDYQKRLALKDEDVKQIEAKLLSSRPEVREEGRSQLNSAMQDSKVASLPVQPLEAKGNSAANTASPPEPLASESVGTPPPSVQPQHRVEIPAQSEPPRVQPIPRIEVPSQPEPSRSTQPENSDEAAQKNRIFLLQWALATAVGEAITNGVLFHFSDGGMEWGATPLGASAAIGGAAFGLFQGLILKRYFPPAHWLVTSVVGYVLGSIIYGSMPGVGFTYGLTFGAISGFVLGVAQWLILRQRFSKAGWWILGSTIGWAICFGLEAIPMSENWTMNGFIGGLVPGVITGGTLLWILKHPTSAQPDR